MFNFKPINNNIAINKHVNGVLSFYTLYEPNIMKNLKILLILLSFFLIGEFSAQHQKMVTIEMYSKPNSHIKGDGVYTYEISKHRPFVIKTIDYNLVTSEKIFEEHDKKNPIETFPLLREEIDNWLKKGFKLFSFNVNTGDSNLRKTYTVILTKDE